MMTIEKLRNQIDRIDGNIIKNISRRNKLSKRIGELKAKLGLQVFDSKREEKLMRYYDMLCAEYQVSPRFVKRLFKIIINNSRGLQHSNKNID